MARELEVEACVVGGGPAGVVLALLLARAGRRVVLLEAGKDFDRDFRGDTVHAGAMELFDDLGLSAGVLERAWARLGKAGIAGPAIGAPLAAADFSRLDTRFPFVAMVPQADLLAFLAGEARRHPGFELVMGANVRELVEVDGRVVGVRAKHAGEELEVRAALTLACDGRASRVRKRAGLELEETSPPMDVLWTRIPAGDDVPDPGAGEVLALVGRGGMLVVLDRGPEKQVGYVVPKGSYRAIRERGLAALRAELAELAPRLAPQFDAIDDWADVELLTVASGRAPTWHRPGLLLLGDAAHPMSPVGGVGINYAIFDAVEAARVLAGPLGDRERFHAVEARLLARVQRAREVPVRRMQAIQRRIQERIVERALDPDRPVRVPALARLALRLPFVRDLPARMLAFGAGRGLGHTGPPAADLTAGS